MHSTRSSVITAILLTFLVCLIGGGLGLNYVAKKYQSDKEALQKQIDELKAQGATEESTIDTSDWKTYTNTEYGYSIKLPAGYLQLSAEDSSALTTISPTADALILGEEGAINDGTDLQIEVFKNQTFETLEELEVPDSAETVTIAGNQAKKWTTDDGTFYLIVKGDDLIQIFESKNGTIIDAAVDTLTFE